MVILDRVEMRAYGAFFRECAVAGKSDAILRVIRNINDEQLGVFAYWVVIIQDMANKQWAKEDKKMPTEQGVLFDESVDFLL